MGKLFGDLGTTIRGIVYYRLSPHEQKPFAGAISHGIPNFVPRTWATIWRWLPTFISGYAFYRYIEWLHWTSHRKNPNDYAHEVDPDPDSHRVCKRVFEPPPKCKKDIPEPPDPDECD